MVNNENYSVRKQMGEALLKLMTKKPFLEMSVTDIVNEAGVARASFYRNYTTTMDLIDEIAEHISDELIQNLLPTLYERDERKWRDFLFDHFYTFKKEYKNMADVQFENLSIIFNSIEKKLQIKDKDHNKNDLNDKYIVVAKVGLIQSITKKWIDSGIKESPEEMVNYIMSFITKF